MIDSQYSILRIPIQRVELDLVVEVEHPLSIPCEFLLEKVGNNELTTSSQHFFDSSFSRLLNLTNRLSRSEDRLTKKIKIQNTVIRDLLSGKYWPVGESKIEFDDSNIYSNVEVEPRIPNQTPDFENLSEIINPLKSYLAKKSGLERGNVTNHTRLVNYTAGDVEYIATRVRLVSTTSGRKQWMYHNGPFEELVKTHIDTIPGFEPTLSQRVETQTEYPYSPEVQALMRLRTTRNFKDKIIVGKEICSNLTRRIREEEHSRLESVHTVVGSSRDMWEYASQVIKSSESSSFLLSSFTNLNTFNFVAEQIQEAKADSSLKQLYLSIGEPDRIGGLEHLEKTKSYLSQLTKKLSPDITIIGGVSKAPTHAKIVISDTGWVLITSSNLLSSSPNNFVLESGALIEDAELARKLIETIIEESWIPTPMIPQISRMEQVLLQQEYPKIDTKILEEKLANTLDRLNSKGYKKKQFALVALENQLQKIAERPKYEIITNENHRRVLIDSSSKFFERLVLASDGLRESGLDKAAINSIIRRANSVKPFHIKESPVIQIWWGRHAAGSVPVDEEDRRGREQAQERLSLFRVSKGKFQFFPSESNEPMETHAKLIIVDDVRVLLTSDNFLSFGDPEFNQGESGELGLLIDHPRIARQTRGQMELWLPEARNNNDLTRWGAAIADEIYIHSFSPYTLFPLEDAIKELLLRIVEKPALREDWNDQFSNFDHQSTIQHIIDLSWNNGGLIGLFHASGIGAGRHKSVLVEQTLVSLSGNPIWREVTDEEVAFSKEMKSYLKKKNTEKVKNHPLTEEEFSQALISEMKDPQKWHDFTTVYDNLTQKYFIYNLKLRGEKPIKYLKKCTEYLEIDIRKGGHQWIKKRSG